LVDSFELLFAVVYNPVP